MFLLQRAAAQLALDELHDGQQVGVRPRHPQDDGVAVTEPERQSAVKAFISCHLSHSLHSVASEAASLKHLSIDG